jgi:hypothetical protein
MNADRAGMRTTMIRFALSANFSASIRVEDLPAVGAASAAMLCCLSCEQHHG